MDGVTIGVLARRAGVNVETVRFYQRRGLLAAPPRAITGYRRYGEEALRQLRFIRHAQALGFSLKEIRELLSLRVGTGTTCADVRAQAAATIARIDERICELERMRAALGKLVEACADSGPTRACPILDALEETEGGV